MREDWTEGDDPPPRKMSHTSVRLLESGFLSFDDVRTSSKGSTMTTRRLPSRSKTTPVQTLHSLLTVQEADAATRGRRPTGIFLLKYDELPPWQRDNHFILTKYRPESNSYFKCFQSLLYLHNESVNIHSHLLGAFLFFFTSISVYAFERYLVNTQDIIAFAFFFFGAVICLSVSAGYHMISNHSPEVQSLHTLVAHQRMQYDHILIIV